MKKDVWLSFNIGDLEELYEVKYQKEEGRYVIIGEQGILEIFSEPKGILSSYYRIDEVEGRRYLLVNTELIEGGIIGISKTDPIGLIKTISYGSFDKKVITEEIHISPLYKFTGNYNINVKENKLTLEIYGEKEKLKLELDLEWLNIDEIYKVEIKEKKEKYLQLTFMEKSNGTKGKTNIFFTHEFTGKYKIEGEYILFEIIDEKGNRDIIKLNLEKLGFDRFEKPKKIEVKEKGEKYIVLIANPLRKLFDIKEYKPVRKFSITVIKRGAKISDLVYELIKELRKDEYIKNLLENLEEQSGIENEEIIQRLAKHVAKIKESQLKKKRMDVGEVLLINLEEIEEGIKRLIKEDLEESENKEVNYKKENEKNEFNSDLNRNKN